MGCLNSGEGFKHWFGNIHLSGPCNRSCYFCIGQHMMDLDAENNLDQWPLNGIIPFLHACEQRNVREINLTGTNTDPGLYKHHEALTNFIRSRIPDVTLGIRTNGTRLDCIQYYDKGSFSIISGDERVYEETMGGKMPDFDKLFESVKDKDWKINLVLGPKQLTVLKKTVDRLGEAGFRYINAREPYGQERIGDPFEGNFDQIGEIFGMPTYNVYGLNVTYWDVHYCHVESINLYANGRISEDYPITRGHSDNGKVQDQEYFEGHKRRNDQWIALKVNDVE